MIGKTDLEQTSTVLVNSDRMTNPNRYQSNSLLESYAGTARLSVVVPIALVIFFYVSMLEYALPLYFEARTELAGNDGLFPRNVWSEVVKYKMSAFAIGPILAG